MRRIFHTSLPAEGLVPEVFPIVTATVFSNEYGQWISAVIPDDDHEFW